jgi:hypothetical protein
MRSTVIIYGFDVGEPIHRKTQRTEKERREKKKGRESSILFSSLAFLLLRSSLFSFLFSSFLSAFFSVSLRLCGEWALLIEVLEIIDN